MKKNLLLAAIALATTLGMVACQTTGNDAEKEREKLNALIHETKNPLVIEECGDGKVDALARTSTVLYDRVRTEFGDYVERTRGPITVQRMTKVINDYPHLDEKQLIEQADAIINGDDSELTEEEKKTWTPETLYKAGWEKFALDRFLKYKKELNDAEDKAAYEASLEPADGDSDEDIAFKKKMKEARALGKEVYEADLAKDNWKEKLEVVKGYLSDAGKIAKNTADFLKSSVQDVTNNPFGLISEATEKNGKAAVLEAITSQTDYDQAACRWLIVEYTILAFDI